MLNKTQLLPDRPGIPPMAQMPDPEVIDPAALARAYAEGDVDLICVLGPTASGKTRYAVQLAGELSRCHSERSEESPAKKSRAFLLAARYLSPENYDAVEALIDDLGLEFLGAEKVEEENAPP